MTKRKSAAYVPPPAPCPAHLTRDAAIEGRARIIAEHATLDGASEGEMRERSAEGAARKARGD